MMTVLAASSVTLDLAGATAQLLREVAAAAPFPSHVSKEISRCLIST